MATPKATANTLPLCISRSYVSTEENKTGSWRFVRPRYEDKTAPCSVACPVAEDIARVEMLVAQQHYMEAAQTILTENPFPAVCGRVCYHPCENTCNRAEFDQPIAIHSLERFVGDSLIANEKSLSIDKQPDNGKKVAVLGAGPAGLSAAYFLSRLGFGCDIFEARNEPGGLLRWGIPAYRLVDTVLESEIRRIEKLGVNIHCGKSINEDYLEDLGRQYDAIFRSCFLSTRNNPFDLPVSSIRSRNQGILLRLFRAAAFRAIRIRAWFFYDNLL